MDIAKGILTALLTSTIVSTVITLVFRSFVETRLNHRLNLEIAKLKHENELALETLKSELAVSADTAHELTERRLRAYPKMVELVYRTRNIARAIGRDRDRSEALIGECAARATELENHLYEHRIDFERDEVMIEIHRYKNMIASFSRAAADLAASQEGESEGAREVDGDVVRLWLSIDKEHAPIIARLSTLGLPGS